MPNNLKTSLKLNFKFNFWNINKLINCSTQGHRKPYSFNEIRDRIKIIYNNDSNGISNFIFQKFQDFRRNVIDDQSIKVLDFIEKSFLYSIFCNRYYSTHNSYQINHSKLYRKEIKKIKEKYRISHYNAEVFYYHNGLRFSSKKIKQYIKNRNILDIGSYDGDSCLVLQSYTNSKIYSYDISAKNNEDFLKNMKLNNVSAYKYELFLLGVGSKVGVINFTDCYGDACHFTQNGNYQINVTTIDNEVQIRNLLVGFIKADVEGSGFEVIKGAIHTLKSQRPVIEIAIYHSFDEFFLIFDFIRNEIKNYIFEFHSENFDTEINLFAYPNELK